MELDVLHVSNPRGTGVRRAVLAGEHCVELGFLVLSPCEHCILGMIICARAQCRGRSESETGTKDFSPLWVIH